jgi:hypothetical protein
MKTSDKEYYGKISVKSFCTNNRFFSGIYGDAKAESNVEDVNRDLCHSLPKLLDKANYYVYDLKRGG